MEAIHRLRYLRIEAERELTGRILPFWKEHTIDEQHGGFVGAIDGLNRVVPEAPKAVVLNARLLWTFSVTGKLLDNDACKEYASRAYAYFRDHFWDHKYGGVYWMIDHRGKVLDDRKVTYAQAFAVYGLSEYYRLTGDVQALEYAKSLFDLVEERAGDDRSGGYFEVFDRQWTHLEAERLSEKDPVVAKSANTHLHVLEAYTTLYRARPLPEIQDALKKVIRIFFSHLINDSSHLVTGLDREWQSLTPMISFGHDIEASWLLVDAAETVGDSSLYEKAVDAAVRMAAVTLHEGVDPDGGLLNEVYPDRIDDDKHWWPQAEASVGFLNAYELSEDVTYLQAAVDSWEYIQHRIVDRKGGEWIWRVSRAGTPSRQEHKVGPWKGPYHNARACLEIMSRAKRLLLANTASIDEFTT